MSNHTARERADALIGVVTCKHWSAPYLFAFKDGVATSLMVKIDGTWKRCDHTEYDEDTLRGMSHRIEIARGEELEALDALLREVDGG